MTQEFHISITSVGQDNYLVRTTQVAPEVPLAEELVTLPIMDWLTQANQLSDDVQEQLLAENSGSDNIVKLGQKLYLALFQGAVRDSWIVAQEIAQQRQEVLRLCLELKETRLALLPWEIMHTGDRFLATDPFIAFSCYQATTAANNIEHSPSHPFNPELLDPVAESDLLGEEDWDEEVDEINYQDPAYEEDYAVIADLFRQLPNQPSSAELALSEPANASNAESLHSDIHQDFSEQSNKLSETSFDLQPKQAAAAATDTPTKQWEAPSQELTPDRATLSGKNLVQRDPGVRKIWFLLEAIGVTAIALVGFWWFQNQKPQKIPTAPITSLSQKAKSNLQTASTADITAIAIQHFNQGDLSAASLAVEALLNRGALTSANTALANVSKLQAETSTINFLRGRLVWQFVQVGDKNYSLDDVLHYWEAAVKDNPDPALYHNALGFAYYAQGDLNKANEKWFQALYLVEEQQAQQTTESALSLTHQDALNAYAGLALVLSKSAQNQPPDKQAKLLSEAIKLRQKVLKDEPINFQPQNLRKKWLWTQQAIQDWRSLLKL